MEPDADHHEQTMQCMEVWGGNRPIDTSVRMPGLDAWVFSKPYGGSDDEGGGDVHYVSSCATGRVTRLLVADVSGHGKQVSDVATSLRSLMRRYVNYIDQGSFIRSMNQQFVTMSSEKCFATAVVTSYFAPTRTLSLCNAGHPPPLFYSGKTKTWELLDVDDEVSQCNRADAGDTDSIHNIPLGVLDLVEYEQLELTLDPGDLVLCYTDSLIESLNPDGSMLGTAGLLEAVRATEVEPKSSFISRLLSRIASLHTGNLDADDVTALLFSPTAEVAKTPFLRRLLAPFRVTAAAIASLRPGGQPAPLPELTVTNLFGVSLSRLFKRPAPASWKAKGDRH